MAHTQHLTSEMRQCIENCLECYRICLETTQHCLTMGGKHAEARHISTMTTCAKICDTSATFMLSGSQFHSRVCGVCAEVCMACAESCASIAEGDELMLRCAEVCRRCAESCRHMASH